MTTAISTSQSFCPYVAEFAQRHGLEDVLSLVGDLTERHQQASPGQSEHASDALGHSPQYQAPTGRDRSGRAR